MEATKIRLISMQSLRREVPISSDMKSASINKLAFYIQMLKARYGVGEYFIEMKINLKSGTKVFPASVKKEGEELFLTFSGVGISTFPASTLRWISLKSRIKAARAACKMRMQKASGIKILSKP